MQQLIGDLQKAEERCVLMEAEVREEVADEMAQVGQRGARAGRAPEDSATTAFEHTGQHCAGMRT